jgi:hypothetical protein
VHQQQLALEIAGDVGIARHIGSHLCVLSAHSVCSSYLP